MHTLAAVFLHILVAVIMHMSDVVFMQILHVVFMHILDVVFMHAVSFFICLGCPLGLALDFPRFPPQQPFCCSQKQYVVPSCLQRLVSDMSSF